MNRVQDNCTLSVLAGVYIPPFQTYFNKHLLNAWYQADTGHLTRNTKINKGVYAIKQITLLGEIKIKKFTICTVNTRCYRNIKEGL